MSEAQTFPDVPACQACGRTTWGSAPVHLEQVGGLVRCAPCIGSYRDGMRDAATLHAHLVRELSLEVRPRSNDPEDPVYEVVLYVGGDEAARAELPT